MIHLCLSPPSQTLNCEDGGTIFLWKAGNYQRNIWFHNTQNGHLNTYCLENLTSYVSWSKIDNTSKETNKWCLLLKFLEAGTQTYLPDSFWSQETSAFEAAGSKEGDKVLYIPWILLHCHTAVISCCYDHSHTVGEYLVWSTTECQKHSKCVLKRCPFQISVGFSNYTLFP